MGELKLYGGSNICYYFHYFIYLETATTQKSKVFFYEFLQEMWMHQQLLLADILKFTKKVLYKNFNFCAY